MNYFSYKIEHDFGLAPNPFGKYCTLAVCKPKIRNNKTLKIGDWVIGTGSAELKNLHHLIFAMKVQGKLTFQEYWEDERFQYKKPKLNGSLVQMYGDNFYHVNPETQQWIQEDSAHSIKDKQAHMDNDLNGEYILFSEYFYYFGDNAPKIPDEYWNVCNDGRNMKSTSIDKDTANQFIEWLEGSFDLGIYGDPISWKEYSNEHNQLRLNV
jgi:hypothetical protein